MKIKYYTCYDEFLVISGVHRITSTEDSYILESDVNDLLKVFFEGDDRSKAILWANSIEIVKDSMHDTSNLTIVDEED